MTLKNVKESHFISSLRGGVVDARIENQQHEPVNQLENSMTHQWCYAHIQSHYTNITDTSQQGVQDSLLSPEISNLLAPEFSMDKVTVLLTGCFLR